VSPARRGHMHLIDERDDADGYAGTFSCTTHPSPLVPNCKANST
jgi:hypothetical protein